MSSHPQPTWVEASHLLPAQSGFEARSISRQPEGHTDSDTDSHKLPTSHSVPARPAHKLTLLQKLSDTWILELLGLIVSAASLAAIVYILRRYDGQRIPDWGSLSFNTLISILAVVSKMAALYGATNAISQLKWAWFTEHGKNLVDYKTFDGGSRGMAGAAMLAWSLKGRNAAVIGALAIIIGVAAGPFAQQIVHFYDAEYVDVSGTAWLARADTIDSLGPKLDATTWTLDPIFKANGMAALFLPTQEVLTQPRFDCPTGNCTFPSFSTVGFCHTCADLSAQLNRTCKPIDNTTTFQSCTVSFPGPSSEPLRLFYLADPQAPGTSTYMVLNSTRTANATALNNLTWPNKVYQSIRAVVPPYDLGGTQNPNLETDGTVVAKMNHFLRVDTPFLASECALTPCVRRISASVTGNVYSETVLETFSSFAAPSFGEPIILSPPWEEPATTGGRINYTIHPEWLEAASFGSNVDPLGGQLMGTVETHDSNQAIRVTDIPPPGGFFRENDALQAVFYADFNGTTCPTPEDNVGCAFRMLAMAMTKSVRDAGVLRNGTQGKEVVKGEVKRVGTFIRIEWPWFALPVAVWGLSLVVVLLAMWKSRGVPLWRDSAFPLVLLGGEHGRREDVKEAALVKRAETVQVSLVGGGGTGLKIVTKGG